MAKLDQEPYFASEAQQVFTTGERVFAIANTHVVKEGAEGVYVGRLKYDAVVDWDTPNGEGYRETVNFAAIKSLYR